MPEQSLAENLSGIWSALHKDVNLTISKNEVHYLTTMALACNDDLVSHLLLKKLRLANVREPAAVEEATVMMNSFVEFAIDGGTKRFCKLVHPSPLSPSYGLSVTTLEGAGTIGMRSGQTILWPSQSGSLHDLQVLHVENCPGLGAWLGNERI
ncbi:hypothetical protein [Sphingosinicella rhizophila]|uniref:Regulator of nucleoside diphosphate kinase n=1 Tax=Sphingosinicella rhizophila TaxID=3050082 RepID=A0ABU3QBX3_9SPHN|nr:hypothetical protein [Sphingosinicella sp. GR2756]MDT9600837.1 hypothetical protein [Sphingosinicella sp. GR2756]